MPRFFVTSLTEDEIRITGQDAAHMAKTLRLRPGEALTLSDGQGTDALARVEAISADSVLARIGTRFANETEPKLRVTLYAALPKSDGAQLIVQKGVEMGVLAIPTSRGFPCFLTPSPFPPPSHSAMLHSSVPLCTVTSSSDSSSVSLFHF